MVNKGYNSNNHNNNNDNTTHRNENNANKNDNDENSNNNNKKILIDIASSMIRNYDYHEYLNHDDDDDNFTKMKNDRVTSSSCSTDETITTTTIYNSQQCNIDNNNENETDIPKNKDCIVTHYQLCGLQQNENDKEQKVQQQQNFYDATGAIAIATATNVHPHLPMGTVSLWAMFCSNEFSYKRPTPPSIDYFTRHYQNDPHHIHPSLIRIAMLLSTTSTTTISSSTTINTTTSTNSTTTSSSSSSSSSSSVEEPTTINDGKKVRMDHNNNTIVASCRLFCKQLSRGGYGYGCGGIDADGTKKLIQSQPCIIDKNYDTTITPTRTTIQAGGIGEVCTNIQHRKRYLSKELLNDCIHIMEYFNKRIRTLTITTTQTEQQEPQPQQELHAFQVSVLHAAPIFFRVYQASGYCNYKPIVYSILTIPLQHIMDQTSSLVLQPPHDEDCTNGKSSSKENNKKNENGDLDPSSFPPFCHDDDSTTPLNLNLNTLSYTVRPAHFPNDTKELYEIYQFYCVNRFSGCIIRSIHYWNQYLAKEYDTNSTLYVLTCTSSTETTTTDRLATPGVTLSNENHSITKMNDNNNNNNNNTNQMNSSSTRILGYLCVREKDTNSYQVRDYGCASIPLSSNVFYTLLQYYCQQRYGKNHDDRLLVSSSSLSITTIQIQIPKVVYDEIKESSEPTLRKQQEQHVQEMIEYDHGWMYKPIRIIPTNDNNSNKTNNNNQSSEPKTPMDHDEQQVDTTIQYLNQLFHPDCPHLIWSIDSF